MSVSREIFLHFLTDTQSGKSYFVDHAGVVHLDNNPTPLPQSPEGWFDSEVAFGRNSKYYGINRSYTNPLKFIGDGAAIIRSLLYAGKGVETQLSLVILKWDDNDDIYKLYYKGAVDLSKADDDAAKGVSVNLLESGLLQLVKANENTVYEFPCDGSIPENVRVLLDGIKFQDTFHYTFVEQDIVPVLVTLPTLFLNNEGDNIGVTHGDQQVEVINDQGYYSQSGNYTFLSDTPTSLRIRGTMRFGYIDGVTGNGIVHLVVGVTTSLGHKFDLLPLADYHIGQDIPFDTIVPVVGMEKVFIDFQFPGPVSPVKIYATEFWIEFASRYKSTLAWGIKAIDLFKLLVKKVTGGLYEGVSQLLQQYDNLVITSGMCLRNPDGTYIVDETGKTSITVIKTSLTDFFASFNAILGGALGPQTINGVESLFFEKKLFVYDASVVTMSLGEVSDLKVSLAEEYFCSHLKIGYPEQQYDEKQGQLEYNCTSNFTTPITRISKDVELISKYRADSYGIEYTRYAIPGNNTVNNKSDNDVFILNADPGTVALETFVATQSIPQTYNPPANITFEQLSGNYFTTIPDKSQFVYSGPSQKVKISMTQAIFKSDGSICSIDIMQNGVSVNQQIVAGDSNTNGNGTGVDVLVAPGDIITIRVGYMGTGVIVTQVLHAELKFTFLAVSVYSLKRLAYDAVSGLINPDSAYNIEDLTPKRMLMQHADYFASTLLNQAPSLIKWTTSSKNQLLSTTLGAVTVTEKADVPVSSLGQPLFYPFYLSFTTKVPLNFVDLLTGAANGHIQFTYNGKTFYGFPMEVRARPSLNETQTWKLLVSPLTDLSDLINLDIDGLNYLNLMGFETFIPHLCPVKFVPLDLTYPAQYNSRSMDNDWFTEQIKFWANRKNYFQKWQSSDIIKIQCQTNGLGPVQVQVLNVKGKVLQTVGLALVVTTAVAPPRQVFQGDIALNTLSEDVYYLLLVAGSGGTTTKFISEGIHLKANWPMTRLIEYKHNRNKQSTIFTEGYDPAIRVECWIDNFSPEAKFSTAEDQPADLEIIDGIPFRKHKLNIGTGHGIPDWMIDKISRVLLLSDTKIDGIGYTRNVDAKFEVQSVLGNPRRWWAIDIRESSNRDGITLTTDGVLDENITVVYNIDTKGFGDGAGSSNIVQVTKID
jgi:hypothetical protein